MSFASYEFLFYFLPLAAALFWVSSAISGRHLFVPAVLVTSIIFYGYSSIPHLILLLILILASWILARLYGAMRAPRLRGAIIFMAVALNLSALMVWKYGASLVDLWNSLGWMHVRDPGLLMPLGISFYALQQMGYLLDLRRGRAVQSSLPEYAAFILFFPQLLAGPIVTHRRMMREFDNVRAGIPRSARLDMAALGIGWISIGLFKKVVLADSLGRIATPLISNAAYGELSTMDAWQIALTAPTRVYFDFCGYSEMAVGLALLFGLKLPANFNAPFRSKSLRQFWSRWHITFHHFVRDHIYGPLSRATKNWPMSVPITLLLTISLSSLWHGSSIQFFYWGTLVWASMFISQAVFKLAPIGLRPALTNFISVAFLIVMGVLFITPDFTIAKTVLGQMFTSGSVAGESWSVMDIGKFVFILLAIIYLRIEISTQVLLGGGLDHRERRFLGWRPPLWAPHVGWLLFFSLLLCVSFYFVGLSPPFAYFQF